MPRCNYVSHLEEATGRIPQRGTTPVPSNSTPVAPATSATPVENTAPQQGCAHCTAHPTTWFKPVEGIAIVVVISLAFFSIFGSFFIFPSFPRFVFLCAGIFTLTYFPFILPCYGVSGPDAKQKRPKKGTRNTGDPPRSARSKSPVSTAKTPNRD